jgi:hypothetical protein
MTKPFDRTKPFKTRNGCVARIITWVAGSKTFPIIGYVTYEEEEGNWPRCWTSNGYAETDGCENPYDLVNVPEVKQTFYNLYEPNQVGTHLPYSNGFATLQEAQKYSARRRIGVLVMTYEDDVLKSTNLITEGI